MTLLLFEVMAKEPPIEMIWCVFLGVGIVGFALVRLFVWTVPLFVAVALGFALVLLMEATDPMIEPAIRAEAPTYIPQIYVAETIGILLPIFGVAAFIARHDKRKLPHRS